MTFILKVIKVKFFTINKYGKKHLVVNQIQLINQKYLYLNQDKSLKLVYVYEFQNALLNLYPHVVIVKHNKFVYLSVMVY